MKVWATDMHSAQGRCTQAHPGEALVLIVSKNKLQPVIRREFDNLTQDDMTKYAKLVNEAKLEELKSWQSLGCFVRIPHSKAKRKSTERGSGDGRNSGKKSTVRSPG